MSLWQALTYTGPGDIMREGVCSYYSQRPWTRMQAVVEWFAQVVLRRAPRQVWKG